MTFDIQGLFHNSIASGMVGSLIGMAVSKECDTFMKKCTYVLVGTGVSFYFAPVASNWLGVTDPSTATAIGCGLGIVWQPLIGNLVTWAHGFSFTDLFRKGGSK